MKFRFEKTSAILHELILYCYKFGAHDFHIDMTLNDQSSVCTIIADIHNFPEDQLKYLKKNLEIPRQYEVETNYWYLGADSGADSELTLVGMMVDESFVEYLNGTLTIVVKRKEKNRR